jgi:hypothetical protein
VNIYYLSRSRFISRFVLFFFFFCKYIYIHIFFLCECCVSSSNKAKKNLRPKNAHCVVVIIVVLCVCVFLAQVFEKDSDTHSYVLSLCVFCANKLSLSTKKIVRLNTSHVRFVVFFFFFLAFCFIVHTGLFLSLSVAFYSRKAMHLFFFFFLLSPFLLLLFWFDDDDYVYGMHSLICFSLICDR